MKHRQRKQSASCSLWQVLHTTYRPLQLQDKTRLAAPEVPTTGIPPKKGLHWSEYNHEWTYMTTVNQFVRLILSDKIWYFILTIYVNTVGSINKTAKSIPHTKWWYTSKLPQPTTSTQLEMNLNSITFYCSKESCVNTYWWN